MSEEHRSPGRNGVPGVLPAPVSGSGAGKAHLGEGGAGTPETSAPRGTEEQGRPRGFGMWTSIWGLGQLRGCVVGEGALGVRAQERKQNARSEEMVGSR